MNLRYTEKQAYHSNSLQFSVSYLSSIKRMFFLGVDACWGLNDDSFPPFACGDEAIAGLNELS